MHQQRNTASLFRSVLLGLAVLAVTAMITQPIYGQATTATLQGNITDSSGAAIPDAKVSVKNTGTGASQEGSSNAQGRYLLLNLNVGVYDVEVSKAGFQTTIRKAVTLNVGADVTIDLSLQVGQ